MYMSYACTLGMYSWPLIFYRPILWLFHPGWWSFKGLGVCVQACKDRSTRFLKHYKLCYVCRHLRHDVAGTGGMTCFSTRSLYNTWTKPCAMVFVKQALYLQNQCHLYICSMTHSPKWHGPAVYILHSNNLQWIKQKKEPLQETSCASAFGKLFLKKWFAF